MDFSDSATAHVAGFCSMVLAAMCLDKGCDDFAELPGNAIAFSFMANGASDNLSVEDIRRFLDEQTKVWNLSPTFEDEEGDLYD